MRKSYLKRAIPLHVRAPNPCPPAHTAQPSKGHTSTTATMQAVRNEVYTIASFEAVYHDPRQKRRGSFDGRVSLSSGRAELFDEESKLLAARTLRKGEELLPSCKIAFGKWEVVVGEPLPCNDPPVSHASTVGPVPRGAAVAKDHSAAAESLHGDASFLLPRHRTASSISSGRFATSPDDLVLNRDDTGAAPVVVDRQLARCMRTHQIEGLQFMFDCCLGRRNSASGRPLSGCILAHSMGLGKSLQALSLTFTLLRSGKSGGGPLIKKALVVCPASLTQNWEKECKRWLPQRLRPTLLPAGTAASAEAVRDFVQCPQQLLIISYDSVRTHVAALEQAPIGLLIADEGQRIKSSSGNQTIDALKRFTSARRVVLTGTPLQNHLGEFWAMADFACPGELGTLASFNASIAGPIDAGRQQGADAHERERAEMAKERLRELSEPFILRRDGSVLKTLLPKRTETVIFSPLSCSQQIAYRRAVVQAAMTDPLPAINKLQQICSCSVATDAAADADEDVYTVEQRSSSNVLPFADPTAAVAKISLLLRLLEPVQAASEQVVICSHFKRSLDLLQTAFTSRGWSSTRLDGGTPVEKRQELVDRFNKRGASETFAFLLSTRAGGTGFNLVGANRMVLFDPDWNPAADAQAMGRIYRDGQKKEVHIWRLLSTSTVEEKIYQRQLFKQGLNGLVDEHSATERDTHESKPLRDGSAFTKDELRQLFTYDEGSTSSTLQTLVHGDGPRQRDMSNADVWVPALPDPRLRESFQREPDLLCSVSYACNITILEDLVREAACSRECESEVEASLPPATPASSISDSEEEQQDVTTAVTADIERRGQPLYDASNAPSKDGKRMRCHSTDALELESDDDEPSVPLMRPAAASSGRAQRRRQQRTIADSPDSEPDKDDRAVA